MKTLLNGVIDMDSAEESEFYNDSYDEDEDDGLEDFGHNDEEDEE